MSFFRSKSIHSACLALLCCAAVRAQSAPTLEHPFTRYTFTAHASSIGFGGSVSVNVLPRLVAKIGGSVGNVGYSEKGSNGVWSYTEVRPRNGEFELQAYPMSRARGKEFFVSSAAVLTTHDWVYSHLYVPGGQLFTWNGVRYMSSLTDPTRGTQYYGGDRLTFKAGVGWANLLRGSRHFAMPIELGVMTIGTPHARAYPAGSVCNPGSVASCRLVLNDPVAQANQLAEAERIVAKHRNWQYVPVVSVGIAYRFDRRGR